MSSFLPDSRQHIHAKINLCKVLHLDATALLKSLPEKINTDEQQRLTLECTGEAGLFVKLSWKKDGKPIVPDGKIMTIVNTGSILEKHKSILTITKATPEHSGLYECIGTPARLEDDPAVSGSEVKIYSIKLFFNFPYKIYFTFFQSHISYFETVTIGS